MRDRAVVVVWGSENYIARVTPHLKRVLLYFIFSKTAFLVFRKAQ